MAVFGLSALGLIFAFDVFQYGGVVPATWYLCLTALGLCAAIYWLSPPRRDAYRGAPVSATALLLAFFGVCLAQIVPLPAWIVSLAAPTRGELHNALKPLGPDAGYATLSVAPKSTFRLLLTLGGYILTYFLAADLCRRWRERPWALAAPFAAIALLEGALGLVQVFVFEVPLANGTYVSRNNYAGLLEMALPFPAMGAIAVLRRGDGGARVRRDRPRWRAGCWRPRQ